MRHPLIQANQIDAFRRRKFKNVDVRKIESIETKNDNFKQIMQCTGKNLSI